jgi:hypothetical protein
MQLLTFLTFLTRASPAILTITASSNNHPSPFITLPSFITKPNVALPFVPSAFITEPPQHHGLILAGPLPTAINHRAIYTQFHKYHPILQSLHPILYHQIFSAINQFSPYQLHIKFINQLADPHHPS